MINYRYFEAGGAERYLFNIQELLEKKGHEVIPFSLRFAKNKSTVYEKYFPDPPGGDQPHFYYDEIERNFKSVFSLLERQFFSIHVYDKLSKLINDAKPDVAYVFHFLRKMSPSVIDACFDLDVPVVVRLSDFALICPESSFTRNNVVCELCQENLLNSVVYKCVKNSRVASIINYVAYQFNFIRKFQNKIDFIVSPSLHTISKFQMNSRFNSHSFRHLPTFVDPNVFELGKKRDSLNLSKRTIVYWGRISYEKGIETLIQSIIYLQNEKFTCNLLLIGGGEKNYVEKVLSMIKKNKLFNIQYIPYMEKRELFHKVAIADVAVVPSICFDNMPNSLIEAQALGLPVIASNIGSMPELVVDGYNGLLFSVGDGKDLAQVIKKFYGNVETQDYMSKNSYKWALEHYSPEVHYQKLHTLFQKIIEQRKNDA